MASPLWNLGTPGYLWLSSLTHTKLSRTTESKTIGQDQDTGQAFPTESHSREKTAVSYHTAALCTEVALRPTLPHILTSVLLLSDPQTLAQI